MPFSESSFSTLELSTSMVIPYLLRIQVMLLTHCQNKTLSQNSCPRSLPVILVTWSRPQHRLSTLGPLNANLLRSFITPSLSLPRIHILKLELFLQSKSGHHDIPQVESTSILRFFRRPLHFFANKLKKI